MSDEEERPAPMTRIFFIGETSNNELFANLRITNAAALQKCKPFATRKFAAIRYPLSKRRNPARLKRTGFFNQAAKINNALRLLLPRREHLRARRATAGHSRKF